MATADRPTVHVPHPLTSLWQSAVNQVIANRISDGNVADSKVAEDPYALAVKQLAAHHQAALAGQGLAADASDEQQRLAHALSTSAMQIHRGDRDDGAVADSIRRFSDRDSQFIIECAKQFIEWYVASKPTYQDWTPRPEGLQFGVVRYRLPADARIALIGDWGTGMPDAAAMLAALLRETTPTAIIHLGDVYYSGTLQEAKYNFLDVIDRCCSQAGLPGRLPTFTIPGNHDYYSGGLGFYQTIDALNHGDQRQQASYFCLRSEDDRWQFLGVDTGLNDHVPGLAFEPFYRAPGLVDSEVRWAQDKLQSFPGDTLMLSHHQLYSARSPLNGSLSFRPPDQNKALFDAFGQYLPKIAVWFWGHEHSLALFKDGLFGLRKGRLLGCSAFEIPAGDGYAPKFDSVGYEQPTVRLGMQGDWLNHGCGLVDLGRGTIQYYEYPSWNDQAPTDAALSLLATEDILGGRL
jgi:hypothetical protein